tara:strand:+ start:114 stop:359 length:246 start_codon:yes stop_codon:yes gene_type:complete
MSKEKIELKVTWRGMMQSYLLFLEMGDDNNRAYATRELMKLADKLDKYNEENDIPYGYLKPKEEEKANWEKIKFDPDWRKD